MRIESFRKEERKKEEISFPTSEGLLTPNEIIEILTSGEVEILGPVEERVPDVKTIEHQNVVNFVLVRIKKENKKLEGIFKPYRGEGISKIKEWVFEEGTWKKVVERYCHKSETLWKDVAYYPREVFAFLVSQKLGLYIVPPTVIRSIEIEGISDIGALQVFIPRDEFQMASTLLSQNLITVQQILNSPDAWKIAVLDFLLGCGRRTEDDILVKIENGVLKLIAIDHGNSMSEEVIEHWISNLPPGNSVTYKSPENEAITFPLLGGIRMAYVKRDDLNKNLPEAFLVSAKSLLEQKEEFEKELKELGIYGIREEDGRKLITPEDYKGFLKRLEMLIVYKKIL